VVPEQEDVLPVLEEPDARQERTERAHLVPEDREVAMVDVEVMVLDVGEHLAREGEALVERLEQLRREQRAVPLGDALTLGERSFARKRDLLAGVQSRDVGA